MKFLESLISPADEQFALLGARHIAKQLDLPPGAWICFGSRAANLTHRKSDLDLLFFSSQLNEFQRLETTLHNTRISAATAPVSYLYDDAHTGHYGGYFAAKLFNPHALLPDAGRVLPYVAAAPFLYFYPFIQFLAKKYNLFLSCESLTALAAITLLNICPEYDAYFLKMYTSRIFPNIWNVLQQQFTNAMAISGAYIREGRLQNKYYDHELPILRTYADFHRERTSRAAQHWSFSILAHNGDWLFYDRYKTTAHEQILRHGGRNGETYRNMANFLLNRSSLDRLFV